MGGTQIELEFSELHVNYDLTATQNGEVVFEETGLHSMTLIATHQIDAVGSDEDPIDVEVVSLGIGAPGNEDELDWTSRSSNNSTSSSRVWYNCHDGTSCSNHQHRSSNCKI